MTSDHLTPAQKVVSGFGPPTPVLGNSTTAVWDWADRADVVADTATYDAAGALTDLSLRFTQICDDIAAPLRGALRWRRA
jgi:hypothetical protein